LKTPSFWTEQRLEDLLEYRHDAVLDVGGGATGFFEPVQEVSLLETLEAQNPGRPVLHQARARRRRLPGAIRRSGDVHAACLDDYLECGPGIVGKVGGWRIHAGAAAPGLYCKRALLSDARTAVFPQLVYMSEVTDRELTFQEAMDGTPSNGHLDE